MSHVTSTREEHQHWNHVRKESLMGESGAGKLAIVVLLKRSKQRQ